MTWVMLFAGLAIGGVLGYLLGAAEARAHAALNQAAASARTVEKLVADATQKKAEIDKQAAAVDLTGDPASVVDKLEHLP
jgi:hypothetical protein